MQTDYDKNQWIEFTDTSLLGLLIALLQWVYIWNNSRPVLAINIIISNDRFVAKLEYQRTK